MSQTTTMTESDLRAREKPSEKMPKNEKVTCNGCGRKFKRERLSGHYCVKS
jgi:hypothetical protein